MSKEEIDEMFDKVTGNVCAGCERKEVCLGERREKTYQMMYEIMCAAEEYGAELNMELKKKTEKAMHACAAFPKGKSGSV